MKITTQQTVNDYNKIKPQQKVHQEQRTKFVEKQVELPICPQPEVIDIPDSIEVKQVVTEKVPVDMLRDGIFLQQLDVERQQRKNADDALSQRIDNIPTANDGVLTIKQNGTLMGTFSANSAEDVEINLTGGGGGGGEQANWNSDSGLSSILNRPFKTLDQTTLKVVNNTLAVNTTDDAEQDNARPITSSGVNVIVGNINAILMRI